MGKAKDKNTFLLAMGERVRALRARRGLTRSALSAACGVSERHLANLEQGMGNASVLVLRDVCLALNSSLAELLDDEAAWTAEWVLIRDLLHGHTEDDLRRVREAICAMQSTGNANLLNSKKQMRIALIGLRGAGKSTLGQHLAQDLGLPLIEINKEIERVAGCDISAIHNLLGPVAYRRYERRALEETFQLYAQAVIAAPGGVVSDASSFNLLLANCYTIWLQASPEEHMQRVLAQGDMRPIEGNNEAMNDLKRILSERAAYYSKADLVLNTSHKALDETYAALKAAVLARTG